jgi:asparagine synthase (glutamine-hydrolysing)
MLSVLYNFHNSTCKLEGNLLENKDKSIQVVYQDGVYKRADQIIPLYEKYGNCCVEHLKDALSFCLYDKNKNQLLVVRDRIGEKQLYYAQLPTEVVFADSLKDVLQYVKRPQIRIHELAQPIRHNYPIDLQHTWIEQIKRVRAGEYAIADTDGLRLYTYWKRNHTVTFQGTKEEAIAETQRLIRASVQRCMQADKSVAVLLSGGIDSTTLALFAKECKKEVHVISAGYKGQHACDERQVAKRFAQEHGLIYHEVELDVDDFQKIFDEYIQYIDEPCFDVSSMSQFALYKKAAEMGFKVILSGLGGDELFYSYKDDNAQIRALQLRREFDACFPLKKNWSKYLKFMIKNWRYVLMANYPLLEDDRLPIAWTYNDYMEFAKTATIEYDNEIISFKDIDVQPHFSYNAGLNEVYDHKFSTFANQLCVYLGNKLGKANGIKLHYPLLDVELIEFLDTLPIEMKFDAMVSKKFQKEVMKELLPDYILYARKRGFEPPFDFIWKMCEQYKYKILKSNHVFFNSMMADKLLVQYLDK